MQNFTLGNLSFICGPSPTQQYGCTIDPNILGLDAPDYRIVQYPNPGQNYGRIPQAFYDVRTITITGHIQGQNATDYLAKRQAFSQACLINHDSNGYPTLTKLQLTALDGNSYFTNIQPQKPSAPYTMPDWGKYQLSMVAPDGRLYGVTQLTSGVITAPLLGRGILVPTIVPVLGSGTTGGSATIFNPGTVESHPIITLTGPLTNPYVQNATTGYSFQIDTTIPGGSSVVVDMYEQSVVYNNSTNFISHKDNYSTWWTVVPGINAFTISTSSTSDTGSAVITAYPAYLSL